MIIERVILRDFRNIVAADLGFKGTAQFFVGPNGQGKTNLLEAIGYATALRSFRTSDQRLLVKQGASEAALAYDFRGKTGGQERVAVRLRQGRKEVTVDREKVQRLGDFIGRFPVVVLSSDDVRLVRGSAGGRRRLIDLTLAAADSRYYVALREYHKALAGRNRLLKGRATEPEISAFEAPLARSGAVLVEKRRQALEEFATIVAEQYAAVTGGIEEALITYRPDRESDTASALQQEWGTGRQRDLAAGLTRRGPHRDDFEIVFSGKRAREYGSEGQQRGLALALRLAQLRFLWDRLEIRPILLADDIVNELDPERRRLFWETLDPNVQILGAGTSLPEGLPGRNWQVFEVRAGEFFPA